MTIRNFEDRQPLIDATAWVDPAAVVIGEVELGADSSIWPHCTVRGDVNRIRIGARTNIQDNSVLHVTHRGAPGGGHEVQIGDAVTVGHRVILHGCRVGDRCLIGMGSIVLDGAVIESECLIGAGSLVPPGKTLESGYLWLGSPVRRVRALTDEERAYFEYSAEHYARLKDRHR